jgi:hypothetical protein
MKASSISHMRGKVMRRAAQQLIAASSVLPIALGARAALLRRPVPTDEGFRNVRHDPLATAAPDQTLAEAYTTVRVQGLYLAYRQEQRHDVNQHFNSNPQMGEKGMPWPWVPPGYQL